MKELITFVSNYRNSTSTTVPVHFLNMSAFLTSHDIPNGIVEIKEPSRKGIFSEQEYNTAVVKKLRERGCKYIGLSTYTTDYTFTGNLIRKIRHELPDATIILGGVHVTLRPQDPFTSGLPVDIVVLGEGEYPLLDIVRGELPLDEIKGICFLKDGALTRNEPRPLSEDLKHLPIPAYDKIDMDFYLRPRKAGIRYLVMSCVHIFTGFGCPFSCTFCASASLYKALGSQKVVRYKTIDQVLQEIRYLKEHYGVESLDILDDTFTLNRNRVLEFCQRYSDEGMRMPWAAETRANLVTEDLVRSMRECGCCQLDFGVEAATQEALDRIKKGITIEDTCRAFDICRREGMRTGANVLLNTNGETENDVKVMKGFLKKIRAEVYYMCLTVPFLGTEIYDTHVKPALTIDEYDLFANPYLYGTITDPRFRLSRHNLPIEKILIKLRMRFVMPKALVDIPLRTFYLKYVIGSRYKRQIIVALFGVVLVQLRKGLSFLCSWLRRTRRTGG